MARQKPMIQMPNPQTTSIRPRKKDAVERWNKTDIDEQKRMQKRALRDRDAWGRDPNK